MRSSSSSRAESRPSGCSATASQKSRSGSRSSRSCRSSSSCRRTSASRSGASWRPPGAMNSPLAGARRLQPCPTRSRKRYRSSPRLKSATRPRSCCQLRQHSNPLSKAEGVRLRRGSFECARNSRRGNEPFRHELPATGRCGRRPYAWSLAQYCPANQSDSKGPKALSRIRGFVLGLDQAAADRVACEVDAVAHAELAEDLGSMGFDRFDAENERRCDLL